MFSEGQINILLFSSFIYLAINGYALRVGFYNLPYKSNHCTPSHGAVLSILWVFFLVQVVFIPTMYSLKISQFSGWEHILGMGLCLCGGFFVYLLSSQESKIAVLGERFFIHRLKTSLVGCLTWFLCYPGAVVVNLLLVQIIVLMGYVPHAEQTAVLYLKKMDTQSFIFWITLFSTVSFVPIIEEVLFRGFLQSWLRKYMGEYQAIVLASLLFALLHFTPQQGIDNVEFIGSLFFLSLYLGFLFERQRSILAPIALHSMFNVMSILMIFIDRKGH